jgi:micrococcal nuclease
MLKRYREGTREIRLAALVATLATLGAPVCTQARVIDGTITRVADGDTVWMQPDDRTRAPIKVRLHGIDAPERCQPWGAQSRDALAARVLLRHVVVSTRSRDDYGRALGVITRDGEDINAWMVAQGHAWSARWHRDVVAYGAHEASARALRRGLFAQHNAIEPRRFRQLHGPCE